MIQGKIQFVLCLLLAIFLPWSFGTVEPWSILAANIIVAVIFFSLFLNSVFRRLFFAPSLMKMICLLFLLWCGIGILFPAQLNLFSITTSDGIERPHLWLPSVIDRDAAIRDWGRYVMAIFLCFSVAFLVEKDREKKIFIIVIILNAILLVVVGILQKITDTEKILWFRGLSWRGDATTPVTFMGPFVNRNHFAIYINMIIPFLWSFWILLKERYQRHDIRRDDSKYLALLFGVILLSGIFFSGSRAGLLVAILQVFAMILLNWRSLASDKLWYLWAPGILLILASVYMGTDSYRRVLESFTGSGSDLLAHDWRWMQFQDGIRMFFVHPFLGWGTGSFHVVYPFFKNPEIYLKVRYVHNDYIQMLVEGGISGLILMILLLGGAFLLMLKSFRLSKDRFHRMVQKSCLVSFGGFCLHAFLDFPFFMTGLLFTFSMVCALGLSLKKRSSYA